MYVCRIFLFPSLYFRIYNSSRGLLIPSLHTVALLLPVRSGKPTEGDAEWGKGKDGAKTIRCYADEKELLLQYVLLVKCRGCVLSWFADFGARSAVYNITCVLNVLDATTHAYAHVHTHAHARRDARTDIHTDTPQNDDQVSVYVRQSRPTSQRCTVDL